MFSWWAVGLLEPLRPLRPRGLGPTLPLWSVTITLGVFRPGAGSLDRSDDRLEWHAGNRRLCARAVRSLAESRHGPAPCGLGLEDVATADYWSYRSAAPGHCHVVARTVDPEALKTVSFQLMVENKISLILCLAIAAHR